MSQNQSGIDVFAWTNAWASETGLKLWSSDSVGSTNAVAKDETSKDLKPVLADRAKVHSAPTLYLTRKQTAGRGRGSNTWSQPEGSTLYASWSFAVARVPQPIFSAVVGLALFEAASETWPLVPFSLKAPNDLYIEGKKTAGILIESVESAGSTRECRTVVGVGMNIAERPADIPEATCLADHLRSPLTAAPWRSFLNSWLAHLKNAVLTGQGDRLEPALCERLRHALNLNPLLKEPIIRVDELAQLHTATGVTHWHEL